MSLKIEEEAYKKIIEMGNNNDYTTGNLLGFGYFKKNYKLIAVDLSKDPQQINFIRKLEANGANSIIEKSEETTFRKFCHIHLNNGNTKDCKFVKWF